MAELFDAWTHDALVERAKLWLRHRAVIPSSYRAGKSQQVRCRVVLSERSGGREECDAIGWFSAGHHTINVECKASRSDFLADQKKFFRRYPEMGMGDYRYYLSPMGILTPDDMPDRWGLLLVDGRCIRVPKISQRFEEKATQYEMQLLVSELARYQYLLNGGDAGERKSEAMEEVLMCLAAEEPAPLTTAPPSA